MELVSPLCWYVGSIGSSSSARHSALLGASYVPHSPAHAVLICAYSDSLIMPWRNRKSTATCAPIQPLYGVHVYTRLPGQSLPSMNPCSDHGATSRLASVRCARICSDTVGTSTPA